MWEGWDPAPLFQNFSTLYVEKYDGACKLGLHLICDDVDAAECMREEMLKLELILQHFKTIHVGVESFVCLVPPSVDLQNLTTLTIADCGSLEDVGAFSIAKNLVNLIYLQIRNDKDLSDSKIVFSKMKSLVLYNLSSLASFSLSLFLEFPSPEELRLISCPNMKFFLEEI